MDRLEAVERLARLRDAGALTEAEYAQQKQILMTSTSTSVVAAPVHPDPNRLHPVHVGRDTNGSYDPPATQHIHIHNANTQNVPAPKSTYNPDERATIGQDARASMLFEASRKSVFVAYLLWFFVGMFSIHRFYLRHWLSGLAQMALGILGPFTMIGGTGLIMGPLIGWTSWGETVAIGSVALGLWFIWIFVDAILMPRLVRKCNENIVHQLTSFPPRSGLGGGTSSFGRIANSRPSTVHVIGGILVLAGAVAVGVLLKSNDGRRQAAAPTESDQPQAFAEPSYSDESMYAEAEPPSVEYEDSAEPEPVADDPPTVEEDRPAIQAPQATTDDRDIVAVDFEAAPILKAKQRAVEKGKAIRWTSEMGSGYAVPSAITNVQGRPCRTVYVTFVANGDERRSPLETLCQISSGNWETAG